MNSKIIAAALDAEYVILRRAGGDAASPEEVASFLTLTFRDYSERRLLYLVMELRKIVDASGQRSQAASAIDTLLTKIQTDALVRF